MSRSKSILWAVGVLLVVVSCGKGAAETAVKAAEDAVESIRADGEMYAPADFAQVEGEAKSARDMVTKGDYQGAATTAQQIPAKAEEVKKTAMAAKETLTREWSDMQASMPGMVEAVAAKVKQIDDSQRVPKGMTKEEWDECKGKLESINQTWSQAASAAQAGQVRTAVESGRQVKAMAEELMAKLGMAAPAGA